MWVRWWFVSSTVLAQGSTDQTGISWGVLSFSCKPVFLCFFPSLRAWEEQAPVSRSRSSLSITGQRLRLLHLLTASCTRAGRRSEEVLI